MERLLEPSDGSAAAAIEACRRGLLRRGLRWRVALACAPAERRAAVATVLAWQQGLRTLVDREANPGRRASALGDLRSEAQAVATGRPRSPLGRALVATLPRIGYSPDGLIPPLDERRRIEHVSAFETRDALLTHVSRVAHPEARLLVLAFGLTSERDRLLAESLATALFLTQRWIHLGREVDAGRLYLPVDEAMAQGVDLTELFKGEGNEGLRRALEQATAYTRGFYVKGWPLVRSLGPLRGRALAFLLRWHAAALAGLEHRGFDSARGAPPAGLLRLLACATSAATNPDAPPL